MANRERFKKLTDLFVRGKHVRLPDGTYLWIQVLNTYERDECLSAAQVARARVVMSLQDNGLEWEKVIAHVAEHGHEHVIGELADMAVDDKIFTIVNAIRDDPEWAERMKVLDETDVDQPTVPLSTEELVLLEKIQTEFAEELDRRRNDERDLALMELRDLSDEEVEKKYFQVWLDKKGAVAGQAEYTLNEIAKSTRFCDAVEVDGVLDLSTGNPRGELVFETAAEARQAPQELQDLISATIESLAMSERDPKDSGSAPASSDSSPMPSEPAASTPSTSTETPSTPPGTSLLQSATA